MYTAAAAQTTTTTDSYGVEGEFIIKEMPLNAHHYPHQTTALLSYQSAPSSFFADLMHEIEPTGCQDLFSADDTASMIATFMDSTSDLQFQAKVKPEVPDECLWLDEDDGHLTLPSRTLDFRQNQTVPEFERSLGAGRGGFHAVKSDGGNYSNLIRHSSSPAGFFTSLNFGNEKADGKFHGNTGEKNQPIGRIRQVNFTSKFIPQNAEEGNMDNNRETHHIEESSNNISHGYHIPEGFQSDSWISPTSITGMKRRREGNDVNQNENFNNSIHQETLPDWLQFQQDFVPCKLRARRGFATHPRSIAERTRRTRISDRMKKLQDLFPNMEKTSISDMLDLAVQHIKNLQKHVEMLMDNQSRCTCSLKQA